MCATKSLRKAKSRLPLWGRWTRVSEDGEGKLPAPAHIRVPRRRLYQRAVHAWGGVTGKLGAKISAASGGTEDPRRGSST